MPSSTLRRGSFDWGWRLAALWIGVLTGPIVWATVLETNYSMSYVACEQASNWMLHTAVLVGLVLIGTAAWLAWNAKPPGIDDEEPSTAPERTALLRARFMAVGGLALCAWFTLAVLAFEVPALLLKPCNP
jgi:hypothetical protein